jgi:6-phosphofructokinase 1
METKQVKGDNPLNVSSYPSGLQAIMKAKDVDRVKTETMITTVNLYKVDRLDDKAPMEKYPNLFQRTKLGRNRDSNVYYQSTIDDDEVVLMDIVRKPGGNQSCDSFIRAGPRSYTVFAPGTVSAAIVTCGGLCPGLNDVVQDIFTTLYYNYGVDNIYGIKSGYRGFWQPEFRPWHKLEPKDVDRINQQGGTCLGSSRGGFDAKKIADSLELHGISQVYVIGGDGTHRAAGELCKEVSKRGLKIVIACVPKTIDNDIGAIDRSFGFNTAVGHAVRAIESIAVEARCSPNGIGIVQLMGRNAGFISANATLAASEVDLCLIPEAPFELSGPNGILQHIESVIKRKSFCVIVVAEGAGEHLLSKETEYKDASGNKKSSVPIGFVLKVLRRAG